MFTSFNKSAKIGPGKLSPEDTAPNSSSSEAETASSSQQSPKLSPPSPTRLMTTAGLPPPTKTALRPPNKKARPVMISLDSPPAEVRLVGDRMVLEGAVTPSSRRLRVKTEGRDSHMSFATPTEKELIPGVTPSELRMKRNTDSVLQDHCIADALKSRLDARWQQVTKKALRANNDLSRFVIDELGREEGLEAVASVTVSSSSSPSLSFTVSTFSDYCMLLCLSLRLSPPLLLSSSPISHTFFSFAPAFVLFFLFFSLPPSFSLFLYLFFSFSLSLSLFSLPFCLSSGHAHACPRCC